MRQSSNEDCLKYFDVVKFLILTGIIALIVALSLAIVVALYRHKRAGTGPVIVIGQTGEVASDLRPEGTVVVYGEVWRARSRDGSPLNGKTRIRVVGVEGHLLVVEAYERIQ
jgi:membrane-bound serine protease (ClpP class)